MGVCSAGEDASPAVQRQGLGYIKGKNMGFPFKERAASEARYASGERVGVFSNPVVRSESLQGVSAASAYDYFRVEYQHVHSASNNLGFLVSIPL